MPHLHRHIDRNALARAQLSAEGHVVPWPQERSLTRMKPPRRAATYRAARRNALRLRRTTELAIKRMGG